MMRRLAFGDRHGHTSPSTKKIDNARNLILWAILCLTIAIALVLLITFSVGSGFAAAALVALVAAYLIPKIISELNDYAGSRGPSDLCILKTLGINILGQVLTILGTVAFGTAALMEIAALAACNPSPGPENLGSHPRSKSSYGRPTQHVGEGNSRGG
jgi:hypothetical protein